MIETGQSQKPSLQEQLQSAEENARRFLDSNYPVDTISVSILKRQYPEQSNVKKSAKRGFTIKRRIGTEAQNGANPHFLRALFEVHGDIPLENQLDFLATSESVQAQQARASLYREMEEELSLKPASPHIDSRIQQGFAVNQRLVGNANILRGMSSQIRQLTKQLFKDFY